MLLPVIVPVDYSTRRTRQFALCGLSLAGVVRHAVTTSDGQMSHGGVDCRTGLCQQSLDSE
jgi:hypothetical protein